MFGYIKPMAAELKLKEYEIYRAFYCGLCKTMGKKISVFSRLTLSYDMVFLCLARTAVTKQKTEFGHFRCKLKPTKKRSLVKINESLLYSSCVSAILVYYKCIDDINDAKNKFKKALRYCVLPFLSRMKKKACGYYHGLEEQIKIPLLKLGEIENKNKVKNNDTENSEASQLSPPSIEAAASCFAELMSNISCFNLGKPENLESEVMGAEIIAKNMGYHLGRWLYIIDALDDFEKDIKSGEYNPLAEYYKTKENIIKDIELVRSLLTASLDEIEKAFSLAGNSQVAPVISNIINLGLCDVQEKIIKKISQSESQTSAAARRKAKRRFIND